MDFAPYDGVYEKASLTFDQLMLCFLGFNMMIPWPDFHCINNGMELCKLGEFLNWVVHVASPQ
jgi:hypothetical protein